MSFEADIEKRLRVHRKLTLRSFLLRDEGEERLQHVVHWLLSELGQSELIGPVHAALRELVQNAAKANLKRVLFDEMNLRPKNEEDYERGIQEFRKYLVLKQLTRYRPKIKASGLYFTISFEYSPEVLVVAVRNLFPLLPVEEIRIREKFANARTLDNLYDFYMEFGDMTEGAGMGIAMVEILLSQAGIDRHNFTVFTDRARNAVTARMIIPILPEYVPPRMRFKAEMEKRGCSAEELRALVRSGDFQIPIFPA